MAKTKRVEFILDMPKAVVVSVAGTFNNWDVSRHSMRKGKDGLAVQGLGADGTP